MLAGVTETEGDIVTSCCGVDCTTHCIQRRGDQARCDARLSLIRHDALQIRSRQLVNEPMTFALRRDIYGRQPAWLRVIRVIRLLLGH